MLKRYLQFKISLFFGGFLTFSLLAFSFILFYTLYLEQNGSLFEAFDEQIYGLLQFTLYQAFLSMLLSLIVGLTVAWALAHQKNFFGRSFLVALFSSSLVLPTLVVAFGIIGIFGNNGWINQAFVYFFDTSLGAYIYGLGGILLAHTYLNASFASRALLHSFESIPKEKYKLAKSLGFSVFERFLFVEYPVLKSTILSVGATIFLLCFTSFGIVLLLGGSPAYSTLEVAIYEAVKLDFDIGMALKLASVQLAVASFFVLFSSGFKSRVSNLSVFTHRLYFKESKGVKFLQRAIIFFFFIFFISPLCVIVVEGLQANFETIFHNEIFIRAFFTSMGLATVSSFLTLFIALLLSSLKRNFTLESRLSRYPFSSFFNIFIAFMGNLYLAIPSLVMGLGFFLLAQRYELDLTFFAVVALLVANVLMSLPFALSVLNPLVHQTAKRYDRLSFSLGLSGFKRWRYVEYPYLKSAMGYVFALSFCFSLGDLGIISLFGSDEFITLPWYLYTLLGSYQTHDASGVALILLVIVLTVFIFFPKFFRSRHV